MSERAPQPATAVIDRMLSYARRIAVVGLSPSPHRESHGVAAALLAVGYDVVPVNPNCDEVLGRRAYPTLADVPGDIDLVDVFRREEHLPGIAQEAVDVGARGMFVQLGLRSDEARAIAEAAGLDYVEDACLRIEVARRTGRPPSG